MEQGPGRWGIRARNNFANSHPPFPSVRTPGPRQGFPYLTPVWGIWCHDQDNNRLRRAPKTRVRDVLLRQTLLGISGTFPLATNTARRWAVMDPYS